MKASVGMKRIVAIAYNNCVSLDLTGPIEAFNYVNLLANEECGQLVDWIESHLKNDLCVSLLADKCAMSPRSFSRSFIADVGHSPMQYITSRRLERARLLLEQTDQSLTSITQTTGFSANNRFSHAFKEAFNVTPAQYRKHFR